MKKKIHPKYHDVLFVDSSTGDKFVCGTALQPKATEKFEGKEYPVCHVSISSSSHPFYTGSKTLLDTAGRLDKYHKRYGKKTGEEAKTVSAVPPAQPETKKGKSKKA